MKKNWYAIFVLALAAWACNDKDYELQSASSDIYRLWVPISYTPVSYAPDSSWNKAELIYVPFENSDQFTKCGALEFFPNGKLDYYDCGWCGTPPVVANPEEQPWRVQNERITFRGMPQWISGDYETYIVSVSASRLQVIQERR